MLGDLAVAIVIINTADSNSYKLIGRFALKMSYRYQPALK